MQVICSDALMGQSQKNVMQCNGLQWFAPAGEILMHTQCYTHWVAVLTQQKWGREFSFNEAH